MFCGREVQLRYPPHLDPPHHVRLASGPSTYSPSVSASDSFLRVLTVRRRAAPFVSTTISQLIIKDAQLDFMLAAWWSLELVLVWRSAGPIL